MYGALPLDPDGGKMLFMNALDLSATEWKVLAALAESDTAGALEIARGAGLLNMSEGKLAKNRERDELTAKLRKLKLKVPWES